MIKSNSEICKAKIFPKLILIICLFMLMGCYSLLPIEEIDNGIAEDSRTWKYYQIIWKPGEKPDLERLLNNYYNDCNPGCITDYILTINFTEGVSRYQNNKQVKNIPEGSWIFLSEVDTCGYKRCKGSYIKWEQLDGNLKDEIRSFDGKKNRIPLNVNQSNNPKKWNYFKINVKTSDDTLFSLLQDDLAISPYLESFTITVNIADLLTLNQYLVIGDESDPGAARFSWSQLSKKVKEGLINWTKPNKVNYSIYGWY